MFYIVNDKSVVFARVYRRNAKKQWEYFSPVDLDWRRSAKKRPDVRVANHNEARKEMRAALEEAISDVVIW